VSNDFLLVSTERFQIPRCDPLLVGRLITFCRATITTPTAMMMMMMMMMMTCQEAV
jgi:hypothetical protein